MAFYKKIILTIIISILAFETTAKDINIAVLAIYGEEACKESWQPTIDYLNSSIEQYTFNLIPIEPGKIDELDRRVKELEIDFVITSPAIYVDLENMYGVSAILTLVDKSKSSMFGSVFIVNSDNSEIYDIDDVKNRSIAAVAEKGFGGWLVGQYHFMKNGVDLYKENKSITFLGTQPRIVQSVISGKYDFGIIRTGMLETLAFEGKININDIRIINSQNNIDFPYLLSSRLYPEWAFAKTLSTPRSLSKKVAKILLDLPQGDQIAIQGGYWEWTTPANYTPVHDLMKLLKVGSYSKYGKVTTYDYIIQNKIQISIFFVFMLCMLVFMLLLRKSNKKLYMAQQLAELKTAQEKGASIERERIARDLHDDVAPLLLTLTHTSESKKNSNLARQAMKTLRESIYTLSELEGFPLDIIIADWRIEIYEMTDAMKTKLSWKQSPVDLEFILTARQKLNLTRILREVVSNALRHAKPKNINVYIEATSQILSVNILHDGSIRPINEWRAGKGLNNIRTRITELGGEVSWLLTDQNPEILKIHWEVPITPQ